MREYKFRAWDKIHNEMIEWEQYKDEMVSNDFWDKNLVVMEWTGLTDKNSKDIYTGDVFTVTQGCNNSIDGKFIVRLGRSDGSYLGFGINNRSVISLNNSNVALTVIGNIFENKELLEYEN